MPFEILDDSAEAPSTALSQPRGWPSKIGSTALKFGETLATKAVDFPYNVLNLGRSAVNLLHGDERTQVPEIPFGPPSELLHSVIKPIGEKIGLGSIVANPDTAGEQFAHNFIEDFGSLLSGKPSFKSLGKAYGIASAGNFADWASTSLGASEGAGKGIKAGTMLLTSLLGKQNINDYVKQQYDIGKQVPTDVRVGAGNIATAANRLKTTLDKNIPR